MTASIKIEAEDMYSYGGFRKFKDAEGVKGVKLACDDWGKLSKNLDCEEGEYDFKINVQDECDGQSSLKIYIDGDYVGTIKLDQDTDGTGSDYNGTYSTYTLPGLKVPKDAKIKIIACGDYKELVRIDCIELCPVEKEEDCEVVTLLHEDFYSKKACDPDDLDSITWDGGKNGWDLAYGKLKTSGGSDGELKFKKLKIEDYDDLCVDFKIKTPDASKFEKYGKYADSFKIYIITDKGKVLLDEFTVNDAGTALVSLDGTKQFSGSYTELSYEYELPDGATWAKLVFDSHITKCDEQIYIDDVKIKGKKDCPPPNEDPEADKAEGCGCADEMPILVDLTDKISDPDGDAVVLTAIDGFEFGDTDSFQISGTYTKTLADGTVSPDEFVFTNLDVTVDTETDEVSFNGLTAFLDLDYGEKADFEVSYQITDENGATAESSIHVTFCGVAEHWDEANLANLALDIPTTVTLQVIDATNPIAIATNPELAYSGRITGLLDNPSTPPALAALEGVVIHELYCVKAFNNQVTGLFDDNFFQTDPTADDYVPELQFNLSLLPEQTSEGQFYGRGGKLDNRVAADEVDNVINWILNQDFNTAEFTDKITSTNSDGVFSDVEIQAAIWGIVDNFANITNGGQINGFQLVDAELLIDCATTEEARTFQAKSGDKVGIYLSPVEGQAAKQPYVAAVEFDDCVCIC